MVVLDYIMLETVYFNCKLLNQLFLFEQIIVWPTAPLPFMYIALYAHGFKLR